MNWSNEIKNFTRGTVRWFVFREVHIDRSWLCSKYSTYTLLSLCVDTVRFVNKFLIVITLGEFRCLSLSKPIEISLYLILDIRNGSIVSNRFATEQPAIRRERTRYGGGVSRHNCLAISQQHLRLWLHYRFGVTLLASRCFSYANSIAFSVESRGRKHAEPICVGSQCRLTISGERPLS